MKHQVLYFNTLEKDFMNVEKLFFSVVSCLIVSFLSIDKQNNVIQIFEKESVRIDTTSLKFQLGRELFYSIELSKNYNTSCATCHLQTTGFSHVDHQLSHGTHGHFGRRNAISLVNLSDKSVYMWDGRSTDLFRLPLLPLTDSLEMDMTIDEVMNRLKNNSMYQRKFRQVYGESAINVNNFLDAINVFLISLRSENSKYDDVVIKRTTSFTDQEQKGYILFKKLCADCHSGTNFTNNSFENNGLQLDKSLKDFGLYERSGLNEDKMKFIVPSLRNVFITFPYMHDGRFQTLDDVLNHYQNLNSNQKKLSKIKFDDIEKGYLRSFLNCLTDTVFLTTSTLGFPPNDNY